MSYHQVNIRTKDTQRSVLVVDAGYFLTREVMRAIEVEGHRLITVPMQADSANLTPDLDKYSTFLNNVVSIAERENPDYLLTVNHLGFDAEGRFTELLEALNLPGLIWYVDSPRYILLNHLANASENVGIFLWDDGYSSWIREAGFEKVHSLPLATDPEIFDVSRGRPLSINNDKLGPLIFVGDSMNEAVDKAFGKLPPELRLNGGNGMGEVIDNFTSRFCDTVLTSSPRNGQPVWDTFSDLLATDEMIAQIAGISTEVELKFESALVLTATRNHRNRYMKAVSDSVRPGELAIYGDEAWRRDLNGSVKIFPPVDYYHELSGVYGNAGGVVNLTGFQMPRGLNQRCFDVPASGGFLLTDAQPAVGELFEPEEEIITFQTQSELEEKWNYYSQSHAERKAIIEKGRKKVLNKHTYQHRIREMLHVADLWFT